MRWDGWLFGLAEQSWAGWTWRSLSSHQSTSPAWPRMVWTTVWKQSNSLNQSRLSKHSIDRNGMFLLEFLKFQPCERNDFSMLENFFHSITARQKFPWWQESPSSSPGNPSHDNDHVLHNKTHTARSLRSEVCLRYSPDTRAADSKGLISAAIISV